MGPLGERNYRLLFVGQASSFVGDGMVPVAISFAVLRLTGSVGDVGLALTAHYAPLACFLIVGGVFADRLPRRLVMIAADLTRFASQGLLAGLLLSGTASLWELLALQAVHGTATAFFNPAVTGLVAETVNPRHLQQANALRWGANSFGDVVGPAVAGILVATIQAGAAVAVDAATFVISAASLWALSLPPIQAGKNEGFLQELMAGWHEFRSRRWLIAANVVAALTNSLVFAPFMVVGPAVAKAHLGGSGAWGLILALFGVGSIGGGLVALRVRPRRPLLVSLPLVALMAIPLALLALHAPAIVIALGAVLAGGQVTLVNVLWETTLQRLVAPELLSRVVAYDWLFALSFTPVGFALAGVLAGSVLGLTSTLWLGAAIALALAASVPLIGDVRRLQVEPETPATVPAVEAS
jgi:predicted MFS family arabinose efflux permease